MIGGKKMVFQKIVKQLYITDGVDVFGFYSGFSLLNRVGLTTQVPGKVELFSNRVAKSCRKRIGNVDFIIKKPVLFIDNENFELMRFIEVMKSEHFDVLSSGEKGEVVLKMIRRPIRFGVVQEVLNSYPLGVKKMFVNYDIISDIEIL